MSLNVKLALLTLVVTLALMNGSIYDKEQHLAHGQLVYLELAPVDPRSLMQGDYMALRFALGQAVQRALPTADSGHGWRAAGAGHVVAVLDERNVASFAALYEGQSLAEKEILLRYRMRHGRVKFATNAFYFQEGHAEVYQSARYGRFRVDSQGEVLLVGLNDDHLQPLTAKTSTH